MVEGKGIEPLTHACKAHVFPLAPTPHIMASREGLEPPQTVLETAMLPLHHRDKFLHTVANVCIKTF